ncbi:aspartate aminotransferase family protein [Pendulispora albinea]|uniref:Aminotransferase class III-fold pyridoxal phosphate-dependent enzyme n=1 Tax=Pendulispora albinea TaxID=2741071 RepID=A0ABZ2MBN7_9BACT
MENEEIERTIEQTVQRYQEHVDPGLGFYMQATLGDVVEWEAHGNEVRDMRGQTWYDALSFMGVFGIGHRHPKVVQAVRDQLDRMPMNARYFFNKPQSDLAARLIEIAPQRSVKNVFFSNSGSEAVDVALKCAKFTTGRQEIISTVESYHGVTVGAVAVSGMRHFREGIEPLLPGVRFIPFGDVSALDAITEKTAGIIIEPVHAGLGSKMAPPGYFAALRERCDRTGAIFIDDEVQTGLGRTGKLWGIDHHPGVAPDIICMGKVLSGGVMPLGATLYSERVADAISKRLIFNTSTFGGGEMACAAGLAAVNVIVEEDLAGQAARGGEVLGAELRAVAQRFPNIIKEVRGVGMMWTIEFSDWLASFFVFPQMIREHRILVAPHLNRIDMIRISPALNARHEDLVRVGQALGASLASYRELDASSREAYEYAFKQALKNSVEKSQLEESGFVQ